MLSNYQIVFKLDTTKSADKIGVVTFTGQTKRPLSFVLEDCINDVRTIHGVDPGFDLISVIYSPVKNPFEDENYNL